VLKSTLVLVHDDEEARRKFWDAIKWDMAPGTHPQMVAGYDAAMVPTLMLLELSRMDADNPDLERIATLIEKANAYADKHLKGEEDECD
jgi:hypothetical protein